MKKFLALTSLLFLTACFDYSDGDRTGTVTKLSKRGFFCKTWEAQMYMGGMKKKTELVSSSDGKSTTPVTTLVANTFEFTIEDESLVPKIQEALESGERITVTYREELVSFCRSDSGSYFVTAVK